MAKQVNIIGENGLSVEVYEENGQKYLRTKSSVGVVGVGENYGWDKFPSGWVSLSDEVSPSGIVSITIDSEECEYTIQGGDSMDNVVQGLVNAINNNSNINSKVDAFTQHNLVFIRTEEPGDKYEGLTLVATDTSSNLTLICGYPTIKQLWKKILIEEDEDDRRRGRIGVFGEVGSRTKADHPIHIVVRKELATRSHIVFADKTVPASRVWYITNVAIADELRGEVHLYSGTERDRVKQFSGDGSEVRFTLDYNSINNSSYIAITIGGTPKILGTDYDIEQNFTNESKTDIVFSSAPASGTNNIEVTYDAVHLCLGGFVQVDTTFAFEFGAPIKLYAEEFVVATVANGSANAGVAILTLNGFYEEADNG